MLAENPPKSGLVSNALKLKFRGVFDSASMLAIVSVIPRADPPSNAALLGYSDSSPISVCVVFIFSLFWLLVWNNCDQLSVGNGSPEALKAYLGHRDKLSAVIVLE